MGGNDAVKFERNFMAPLRNYAGKNLREALRNSAPKKQETKRALQADLKFARKALKFNCAVVG